MIMYGGYTKEVLEDSPKKYCATFNCNKLKSAFGIHILYDSKIIGLTILKHSFTIKDNLAMQRHLRHILIESKGLILDEYKLIYE